MVLSNKEDNYAWSFGAIITLKMIIKFLDIFLVHIRSPRLDEIITVVVHQLTDPLKHQFSHDIELGYEYNLSDQRYKISAFKH